MAYSWPTPLFSIAVLVGSILLLTQGQMHMQQRLSQMPQAEQNCTDKGGKAQACYPPFVSAATKRRVNATNTCGLRAREKFCRTLPKEGRMHCAYCFYRSTLEEHKTEHLTDVDPDRKTWWQSQTLNDNRTIHYEQSVNLTIDLGIRYHLAHINLAFLGYMPSALIIHRKINSNSDWEPWAYFAESCQTYFQMPARQLQDTYDENNIDEIRCYEDYRSSKSLQRDKEPSLLFPVTHYRISERDFYLKEKFRRWASASEIKIEIKKFFTHGGERHAGVDTLLTYYVAISDLQIGGRCDCNGHGSFCRSVTGLNMIQQSFTCECDPAHHTEGYNCERCQPLYNDVPWRVAHREDPFACQKCNCNGMAERCVFDMNEYIKSGNVSGGVCTGCKFNTTGRHCDRCLDGFYKDPLRPKRCIPCDCDLIGTVEKIGSMTCNQTDGQCECKPGVGGRDCKQCKNGYYSKTSAGCLACNCSSSGTADQRGKCDKITGDCRCKKYVTGPKCDQCKINTYGLMETDPLGCKPCFCNGISGDCELDRDAYGGGILESINGTIIINCPANLTACDACRSIEDQAPQINCEPNRFGQLPCMCKADNKTCTYCPVGYPRRVEDPRKEICKCPERYEGKSCQRCKQGFYKQKNPVLNPDDPYKFQCVTCDCNNRADSCDPESGQCFCRENFGGLHCERCADGYYESQNKCHKCPCPDGSKCRTINDSVECFDCPNNRTGRKCEVCVDNFYGNPSNGIACKPCQCNSNVFMNQPGNCDRVTGKCLACQYGTTGDHCEKCLPGHRWKWRKTNSSEPGAKNLPQAGGWVIADKGCLACKCSRQGTDLGPQGNIECEPITGACSCKAGVEGAECDRCMHMHFNLYSGRGCEPCKCDSMGSNGDTCHLDTGKCYCLPNVEGDKCDRCRVNHFDIKSGKGCIACECNRDGSTSLQCDLKTGQCPCSPIARGLKCDRCQENHFDLSIGCRPCHVCYNLIRDQLKDIRVKVDEIFNSKVRIPADEQQAKELIARLQNNVRAVKARVIRLYDVMAQHIGESTPVNWAALDAMAKAMNMTLGHYKKVWQQFTPEQAEIKSDGTCMQVDNADDVKKMNDTLLEQMSRLPSQEAMQKFIADMDRQASTSYDSEKMAELLNLFNETSYKLLYLGHDDDQLKTALQTLKRERNRQNELVKQGKDILQLRTKEMVDLQKSLAVEEDNQNRMIAELVVIEDKIKMVNNSLKSVPSDISNKINDLVKIEAAWKEVLDQNNATMSQIEEAIGQYQDQIKKYRELADQVDKLNGEGDSVNLAKEAFMNLERLLNRTQESKDLLWSVYNQAKTNIDQLNQFKDLLTKERNLLKKNFDENYANLIGKLNSFSTSTSMYLEQSISELSSAKDSIAELDRIELEIRALMKEMASLSVGFKRIEDDLDSIPKSIVTTNNDVGNKLANFGNDAREAQSHIEESKENKKALDDREADINSLLNRANALSNQVNYGGSDAGGNTDKESEFNSYKDAYERVNNKARLTEARQMLKTISDEIEYLQSEYEEFLAHKTHLEALYRYSAKEDSRPCTYASHMIS